MNKINRVTRVFNTAEVVSFDNSSKFILMSDVHRGDGTWADTFARNQTMYFAALNYYYKENYTYIEIGDGDELWENKKFRDIISVHSNVFWLLSKFYREGRLHLIFGNHDMVKKDSKFIKNNLAEYLDDRDLITYPLFPGIKIHEGLVLKHRETEQKIFLIHGHQVSFLDYDIWRIARFLVRYLWRPLESFGVNDPTSTAKNYKKKDAVEYNLIDWVKREKHMLISGHTHRPMFPDVGNPPYFNDGSSVHPRCVTGIEIVDGAISLIKWSVKTRSDGTLFIGRSILAGPRKISDYFNQK